MNGQADLAALLSAVQTLASVDVPTAIIYLIGIAVLMGGYLVLKELIGDDPRLALLVDFVDKLAA